MTSQNAEEFIGRELGVRTVFVHENFSGESHPAARLKSKQYSSFSCNGKKCLHIKGELFDRLVGAGAHILGPPAIKGLRARGEPLLVKRSPVFCLQVRFSKLKISCVLTLPLLQLLGCNIVFSGYRRKADVKNMLQKVTS